MGWFTGVLDSGQNKDHSIEFRSKGGKQKGNEMLMILPQVHLRNSEGCKEGSRGQQRVCETSKLRDLFDKSEVPQSQLDYVLETGTRTRTESRVPDPITT